MAQKHYVATYISNEQKTKLDQLGQAKKPHRQSCYAELLRDCIDYAYRPLLCQFLNLPNSTQNSLSAPHYNNPREAKQTEKGTK